MLTPLASAEKRKATRGIGICAYKCAQQQHACRNTHTHVYIYIYIYIYTCVCVCSCVHAVAVHMCAHMPMRMVAFRFSADASGVCMLQLRYNKRIVCSGCSTQTFVGLLPVHTRQNQSAWNYRKLCNIACRAVLTPAVQHGLTSPAYSQFRPFSSRFHMLHP